MVHMAQKLFNLANMDHYGSVRLIGVYAAHYDSRWLQMALIAKLGSIQLHMDQKLFKGSAGTSP